MAFPVSQWIVGPSLVHTVCTVRGMAAESEATSVDEAVRKTTENRLTDLVVHNLVTCVNEKKAFSVRGSSSPRAAVECGIGSLQQHQQHQQHDEPPCLLASLFPLPAPEPEST